MFNCIKAKNWLILLFVSIITFGKCHAVEIDSLNHLLLASENSKETIDKIENIAINISDSVFSLKQSELLKHINKLEKIEDKISFVKFYYFLGYTNYIQDDDIEALKHLLTSLQFLKGHHFPYLNYRINYRIADCYSRIRHYTSSQNLYEKTISYYLKAAAILETLPNNDNELISIYTAIGHFYHGHDNTEKSEEYYKKAIEYAKKTKSDANILRSMINIGNFYFKHEQIEKGEKITFKALHYADSIQSRYYKTYCLINICQIKTRKRDYDAAIEYAEQTYKEACHIDNAHMKFRAKQEQGRIYNEIGQTQKAIQALEESIRFLDPDKDQRYINPAIKELSNIYFEINKFNKSSYYQQKYIRFSDSMNRADYNKRIALAEALNMHESITFKNKLLDKENKLKKAELSKSKITVISSFIFLILFIGIIAFQIRSKNKYRKQNIFITRQNKIISNQNQAIKQQNIDLFAYKNKLEQLVSERTNELKEALVQAENSNQFKSEFLKNITHEIRTPLNAIVGFSYLVEQQSKDNMGNSLSIIKQNSYELLNTVEKIIEVADIETLCQNIEFNQIKLSDLNDKIITDINRFIKETHNPNKHAEFILEKSEVNLDTDAHKLIRILIHIIDNALKFDHLGTIKVSSKLHPYNLDFIIKDSGIGIKPEDLKMIFEAFKKPINPNQLYRGLGVGLTIANKLTKALNGDIRIESEPNKGTKVIISIPTKKVSKAIALSQN